MSRIAAALLGLALCAVAPAAADDAGGSGGGEAAALAERHFRQLYGFDALEAYEARSGDRSTRFVVARRWSGERPELLFDLLSPAPVAKWAGLMRPQAGRPDDLFLYTPSGPTGRRVRRLTPVQMQSEPIAQLFPLGELRPIGPREVDWVSRGEASVADEPCARLEGRPAHGGLWFERIELCVSRQSGFALETRYYRAGREVRRVSVAPGDIRELSGRMLPIRREIRLPGEEGVIELELRNLLVSPEFPARFFSAHNLRVQRFPRF